MSKITNLTEATSLDNANDWLVAVDVSDTTQSASGTNKKIKPSNLGVGGALEYQTAITTNTTLDGTQKGLNNVYPVDSSSAVQITITTGDYVENDVIVLERQGQGTVEIVADTGVKIRGVRDSSNRYFINDQSSRVQLTCRGSEEFTIIGNLTRGYTGSVATTSYTDLNDGDVNAPITVTGTGFSSNMKDPVLTGNATLVSWNYVSNTEVTLNITETGSVSDTIDVTWDNGEVTTDTSALTIMTAIPTGNLIAYYRFNSDVTDETGTHNGTANAITYTAGKMGNSAVFNGSTSYVDIADNNEFSFGDGSTDSAFSITGYVKFTTVGASFIVSKRNSPADKEWQLDYTGTAWRVITFDQSSGGTLIGTFTDTPSTGVWYHIAWTYSGSGTFAGHKFFIDNSEKTLVDGSGGSYTAMENLTEVVRFGDTTYISTNELDGELDGFGIWDKELSSLELTAIYDKQNGGTELL